MPTQSDEKKAFFLTALPPLGALISLSLFFLFTLIHAEPNFEDEDVLAPFRAEAETSKKAILILSLPKENPLSKQMQERVLSKEGIQQSLKEFLLLQFDPAEQKSLAKKFHLGTEPVFLVLNAKENSLSRWQGFFGPASFQTRLNEGLRLREKELKGEEWETTPTRPKSPMADVEYETLPSPTDNGIEAICFTKEHLWTLDSLGILYQSDLKTGDLISQTNISRKDCRFVDICADAEHIYILPKGWTQNQPILRFSPQTLGVDKELPPTNKAKSDQPALAIAFLGGDLWVAEEGGRLTAISPATSEPSQRIQIGENDKQILGPKSLCALQDSLLCVLQSRSAKLDEKNSLIPPPDFQDAWEFHHALGSIQPATGKILEWIPLAFPVSAIAIRDGKIYMAEIWPEYYDKYHRIQTLRPKKPVIHIVRPKTK